MTHNVIASFMHKKHTCFTTHLILNSILELNVKL